VENGADNWQLEYGWKLGGQWATRKYPNDRKQHGYRDLHWGIE
jgi:hypothetical protein